MSLIDNKERAMVTLDLKGENKTILFLSIPELRSEIIK